MYTYVYINIYIYIHILHTYTHTHVYNNIYIYETAGPYVDAFTFHLDAMEIPTVSCASTTDLRAKTWSFAVLLTIATSISLPRKWRKQISTNISYHYPTKMVIDFFQSHFLWTRIRKLRQARPPGCGPGWRPPAPGLMNCSKRLMDV